MVKKSKSRQQIYFHAIGWLCYLLIPFIFIDKPGHEEIIFLKHLLFTVFLAGFFYTNYFFLIPQILGKKKIIIYILLVLISFAALACVQVAIEHLFNPWMFEKHRWFMQMKVRGAVFSGIFVFTLSTIMKITGEWFRNEQQRKQMEHEQVASELAFLKSQVNPHFLLNTLNNIYTLALKKSDGAPDAIMKLSQMMRYMLYESDDAKVPLEKEVSYLKSYIDLQKMRVPSSVKIDFFTEGIIQQLQIEPMLLIPFVENAFKHGISYLENSAITIRLKTEDHQLMFSVENTVSSAGSESKDHSSGIGMQNVRKRLALLYPGKHTLSVNEEGGKYFVNLLLKIT